MDVNLETFRQIVDIARGLIAILGAIIAVVKFIVNKIKEHRSTKNDTLDNKK